jgi:hypothetical protein
MIGRYNPNPFGRSLLGSFENLDSVPFWILSALMFAFWSLRVISSFVRPSFSPLFPASHSGLGLKITRGKSSLGLAQLFLLSELFQ